MSGRPNSVTRPRSPNTTMRAIPCRGDVEHRDPERPQHAIVVATVGRSRGLTIGGEGHHPPITLHANHFGEVGQAGRPVGELPRPDHLEQTRRKSVSGCAVHRPPQSTQPPRGRPRPRLRRPRLCVDSAARHPSLRLGQPHDGCAPTLCPAPPTSANTNPVSSAATSIGTCRVHSFNRARSTSITGSYSSRRSS